MDALFLLHIVSNIMGVSCFAMCAVLAVTYLVKNYQLKSKHVQLDQKSTLSLETLDSLLVRMLITGFGLLSIGLLTGMFRLNSVAASAGQGFGFARALAIVSWCVFGWVLISRVMWGWRGRRAAFGMLVGCIGVVATLIGYFVRTLGVR